MSDDVLAWCVVANVRELTQHGVANSETRSGTIHFSAGTKVWVLPPQWGDGGEDLFVLGRHRGRRGGHVRIVIPRRHLENFRVKPVYSGQLLEDMKRDWREDGQPRMQLWRSREEAEQTAANWSARPDR